MIRIAILRILESYFRHRWLYLVPIVLLALIGLVSIVTAEPKYISWGIVYVQKDSFLGTLTNLRSDPYTYLSPAQETAGQITELMQTNAFIRSVVQDTKLEEMMDGGEAIVNEVMFETRSAIWVQPLGSNQIIINATHTDPELAMQLSDAVISRFIQWQINLDQVQSGAAEEFMDELVVEYADDLEAARTELQTFLEAHPEPERGDRPETETLEINRLNDILSLASARYARALEQQEGARLATTQAEADVRQTFFVVDAPAIPKEPFVSLRDHGVKGIIFVVVGVIIAAAAIAGAAVLDRSFRFTIDVEYGLSLPVLSVVPDTRPKLSRLAFLQRRAKKPAAEQSRATIGTSLADDEAIEVTV